MAAREPVQIATALAALAGRPRPEHLAPLAGGRNNQVFRVDTAGEPFVLKLYHRDPNDPRDRLAHEWSFLTYARQRNVAAVPEPIAVDTEAGASLLSFVPGERVQAGQVERWHLDEALSFILQLNAPGATAARLPLAAEACMSVADHLSIVDRRVERLRNLDPEAPCCAAAEELVRGELLPLWRETRERVSGATRTLGIILDETLEAGAECVSPSDVGFHNALVSGRRVTFIDFEYAGRDDPAKLVADLFCCPEAPPPFGEFESFVDRLFAGLGLADVHAARCRLLIDVHRLKWACIVLNQFLPIGRQRRAFAAQTGAAEAPEALLARTRRSLAQIGYSS